MSEPLPICLESDVNLSPFNTLGVGAKAHRFLSVTSVRQLQQALEINEVQKLPKFILGGGSNVLFLNGFSGCVLRMEIKGRELVKENDRQVWFKIGAGENWHETVLYCVEEGLGGIENLSLIPGTVGAAPIQNIGAYGVELEELFDSLEAVEIASGEKKTFTKKECRFGYRDSIFKNELKGKFAVTSVTLCLSKQPEVNTTYGAIEAELEDCGVSDPTIRDVSEAVIRIRSRKLPDPKQLGNAGSFFKNPIVGRDTYEALKKGHDDIPGYALGDEKVKVPAGWLIEQAGWKGKMIGKAGTYEHQALVIVNHGGATGGEILELSRDIRSSVYQKFGIELVPEVNIIS